MSKTWKHHVLTRLKSIYSRVCSVSILMFLRMNLYIKRNSKTFLYVNIFGYDEYFSIYSHKTCYVRNFVLNTLDINIKIYIILTGINWSWRLEEKIPVKLLLFKINYIIIKFHTVKNRQFGGLFTKSRRLCITSLIQWHCVTSQLARSII